MSKFHGKIGFSFSEEVRPGVWTNKIVEKEYYGDVIKNVRRWDKSENLNDDFTVDNSISIVANSFLNENAYAMKYVKWMGTIWRIASINNIEYPRLTINLGGVYNGEVAN